MKWMSGRWMLMVRMLLVSPLTKTKISILRGRLTAGTSFFASTRDGWSTLPGYTPDEYESTVYGDEEIYIMNPDGSDQRNLTQHPHEGDTFPAWSPGGYIAFTRHGGCIMVMRADGTAVAQVNQGTCADGGHFVSWSPS